MGNIPQGQYELAQRIRKVTNYEEGAIDRLIIIHEICSDVILAYEADDSDTHDHKDND